MMLSLVWGRHAIPVYWQLLEKKGSSSLQQQKKIISPVLHLLRPDRVLVLGDREFHSVRLAHWLCQRQIDFALRQKIGLQFPIWLQSWQMWPDLATQMMNLKPHKRLNFQQGMKALALIQSTL